LLGVMPQPANVPGDEGFIVHKVNEVL
jgi:hypothetical protein